MTTRAIRIDPEVMAALDAERRPSERNYNDAILRAIKRARLIEAIRAGSDADKLPGIRRWL